MFDILDVINEATKEANSFENHAAKELSLEERLLYLQGLSLVMNADGEIHEDEKEYLRILIKSFEMDDSILDSFVEFAQAPDKDTVQAFFRTFRRKPIAQLFLFDALMMTRRDGSGCDREKAVVDKIAEQLEVLKGTYSDIYDLFCHIKNRNWQQSSVYFSSHLLNPKHFRHLLDYFEVDFDELLLSSASINKSRLLEIIRRNIFSNIESSVEWGAATNVKGSYSEITKNPVRLKITHSILLTWLQSLLDKGLIRIFNDDIFLIEGSDEKKIGGLSECNMNYDNYDISLSLKSSSLETDMISNSELNKLYFLNNFDVASIASIVGGEYVAIANGQNLPCFEGRQVSAVTARHKIGINGHPNAISEINESTGTLTVRWCNHCSSGHGSTPSICDDGDRRFTLFNISDFIADHGLYLVR